MNQYNNDYNNWLYLQMPIYDPTKIIPMNPGYIGPFYNNIERSYFDDLYEDYNEQEDDGIMRQPPQDINRIMALINQQFNNYYTDLQRYRVQRVVARNIFRNIVTYVLRNENRYTGNIEQRTTAIFNAYVRDNPLTIIILRRYGVPINLINQIIRAIIHFTLENIDTQTTTGWSQWEDLGGILTSAPAVSTWQANRLDVFGKGQNNALWHNWWNGSSWSQWEDLGGILTSAPAVASWQANRLDVFGKGQNNALWHKWWNGSSWSQWEDLGGVLTSAPAAVSWGPNRIDVFGKGQNNNLWHKWWNGSSWSQWEDLGGGIISSGPAAASTAPNRLEIFARGGNNQLLFRTWNGIRWSDWQAIGGVLTSEPAAVSWGGNRLDVFAKGQNNHLWHIWRP